MKFYDMDREVFYTLKDMKDYYLEFVKGDEEYCECFGVDGFITYMYIFLMDTLNGRNDLEIVGMTPHEVGRFIESLRKRVTK